MKTVQMTLDEDLVAKVDRVVRKLRTTRSAFARQALRDALKKLSERAREERHAEGYRRKPIKRGELDVWGKEQVWPEP